MPKLDKTDKWSEKDYLKKVYSLMDRNCSLDNYRRSRIARAYDYYYGKFINDQYTNLLNLHELPEKDANGNIVNGPTSSGSTPYERINWDAISPKINLLLGELNARGFDIRVTATNRAAAKRRKARRNQLKFLMQMQPILEVAAQESGVDFGINEGIPKNERELNELMNKYRDGFEVLVQEAMVRDIRDYDYKYLRKLLKLDLLVTNECHLRLELRNGYAKWERVNPLFCIPDISAEGDFLNNGTAFIEASYAPRTDVIEQYNIKGEDLDKLLVRQKDGKYEAGIEWEGILSPELESRIWMPFMSNSGYAKADRVLVVKAQWLDTEEVTQKVTYDQYGNMHVHEQVESNTKKRFKLSGKEKSDERSKLVTKRIQVVRHATIIGGSIVAESGKTGNYVRSFHNPSVTKLNYISAIHNYNNQVSTSLVEKLGLLQDFKNYVLTLVQKELTTHIGSVVAIDVASIDPDIYGASSEASDNVLQMMKAYKVVFFNSKKGGLPELNGQPVRLIDPKVQNLISEGLTIANFVDKEMEQISGINSARQGLSPERQLASTNQMNHTASTLITDTYFQTFNGFERRIFERHAKLVAMSWATDPAKYEMIAEQLDIELPQDFYIDIQTYRVEVETFPLGKNELIQMINASVAQGNMMPADALELLEDIASNLRLAIKKFIKKSREREEQQLLAQQQQFQQQQEFNQRQEQFKAQNQMGVEKMRGDYRIQEANIKTRQGGIEKAMEVDQRDRAAVSKRESEIYKSRQQKSTNE